MVNVNQKTIDQQLADHGLRRANDDEDGFFISISVWTDAIHTVGQIRVTSIAEAMLAEVQAEANR